MTPKKAIIIIIILFIAIAGFFGAWYLFLQMEERPAVVEKPIEQTPEPIAEKTKEEKEQEIIKIFEELKSEQGIEVEETTKEEKEQAIVELFAEMKGDEEEPKPSQPTAQFPVVDEETKAKEKEILKLFEALEE